MDVRGREEAATVGLLDLSKLNYDANLSGQTGKLSGTCRPTKNSPKVQKDQESGQPVGVSETHKGAENRNSS